MFSSAEEFNGRRLINHVVNVADVLEEGSCRTLCYAEPNCVSFNFKMAASLTGHYKCELNNSTHEGHEDELEGNPIYVYYGSEVSLNVLDLRDSISLFENLTLNLSSSSFIIDPSSALLAPSLSLGVLVLQQLVLPGILASSSATVLTSFYVTQDYGRALYS